MLRVLLATNSRDRGSTSRVLESWARLLPSNGIDPVVTVGGPGPLLDALVSSGVPTVTRRLDVTPDKRWPFPFALAVLRMARTIRRTRAALVHLNEHDRYPVVGCAARLAGVPVVVHIHSRIEEAYCRWLFKPSRPPARLFFPSHAGMASCRQAIEATVSPSLWHVVPNGLDFASFGLDTDARARLRAQWRLDAGTVALGMACAISPIKRVEHFARLVARLHGAGVPVQGFVAGGPHFPQHEKLVQDLRSLAETLGIADRFHFLGYVEPVEPLYHAWDICLATSEHETFGMSMLEAMACNCAVVAYATGALPEVVGDAGCLVPDGNEDALFNACLELCVDAQQRRLLAEAGHARARARYDVRVAVSLLANGYKSVRDGLFSRT